MKITFHGAAGSVTGSCYLVESGDSRFLVDCGLFQGARLLRELNYEPFAFDASSADFALLTHAHMDHSGLLPKLVRHGFQGEIYTTGPTAELLEGMLPDSADIQKTEVARKNRKIRMKGGKALEPIYDERDVERTLRAMHPVAYRAPFQPAPGVRVSFFDAGHVLGSASLAVDLESDGEQRRVIFSGDVGSLDQPIVEDPDPPLGADFVVLETTYGSREQPELSAEERLAALEEIVLEAFQRKGNLIIPAFALERTQVLLHDLQRLMIDGRVPRRQVYLDSPLAIKITKTFAKYVDTFDEEASETHERSAAGLFQAKNFHMTRTAEESRSLNSKRGVVILSASGMCDAGRIKHHLRQNLPDPEATVLFVGYQAPGTLGRLLSEGREQVRIHGRRLRVRAQIAACHWYSGHADQRELLRWLAGVGAVRRGVILTHGEHDSRVAFAEKVAERFGYPTWQPELHETIDLLRAESRRPEPDALQEHLAHAGAGDSYNSYSQFLLDLADFMEGERDERGRRAKLEELSRVLTAGVSGGSDR